MELYLQFGYGMIGLARDLLAKWRQGGVVLSPRDLEPKQLPRVIKDLTSTGSVVLLDPQCYSRDFDHPRLQSHGFWKSLTAFRTGSAPRLDDWASAMRDLGIERHILPGIMTSKISEDWFVLQERILSDGSRLLPNQHLLMTLALGADVMMDENQVETLIERAAKWEIGSFYIVPETPGPYLVDNPDWLSNLMNLVAGLKLQNRFVIVGYSNHQMLCLGMAKADVVCSGNYRNVRAFPMSKFYVPEAEEITRKAVWYYCPHAMSEYKMIYLDRAKKRDLLAAMRPQPPLSDAYAEQLFGAADPSSVEWGEGKAFRHYLSCLRTQVREVVRGTFDETVVGYKGMLEGARTILAKLRARGIMGIDRDFASYVDVNLAAAEDLVASRGALLTRKWAEV